MSNSQVGNIYQQIINDVLEASRGDFEEVGLDDSVMDELKTVSEDFHSLSSLAVGPPFGRSTNPSTNQYIAIGFLSKENPMK